MYQARDHQFLSSSHPRFTNEGTGSEVPEVTRQEVREQDAIQGGLASARCTAPGAQTPPLQQNKMPGLATTGCLRAGAATPAGQRTDSARPKVLPGTQPSLPFSSISAQHRPLLKATGGVWGHSTQARSCPLACL